MPVAAACAVIAASLRADAAGLYFADRGVRPFARGGAFIAGADDLGAIAYNPAGIYDAGAQFLFDGSWLHFTSDYTRKSIVRQIDPNTGRPVAEYEQTHPSVHGTSPVLPIPTIAGSFMPHERLVLAVGAWAPYAAITSYPESVEGRPAPQRYGLLTLDGSALAFVGIAAAFAPAPEWRVGAGFGVLAGSFRSTVVFSGCVPDRFLCAPEQPEWDVLSELVVGPIVAPSGELGAIWAPTPKLRIGASVQLPVFVRAPATIKTRLPSTPVFERASQEGEDADVAFDLPWNVRFGIEGRFIDGLRVEVGGGFERWSMHDEIRIEPRHIALKNVAAFPETYNVPPVTFPRNFRDSFSARVGAEYSFDLIGYLWDARGGFAYETSAVPPEYLSVMTIDAPKGTLALGVGLHIGRLRVDAGFAHVFAADVEVSPRDARIPQISPVVANPPAQPNYINGGTYSSRANVLGVGLAYTFDPPPERLMPGGASAPAKKPEAPASAAPEKGGASEQRDGAGEEPPNERSGEAGSEGAT